MADREELLARTAEIVAAHLSNNTVGMGDVANLVTNVYGALAALGEPAPDADLVKREPRVSPRSSVKADHLVCLIDGSRHKMLKGHLRRAHGMSPAEYRAEFGLKDDYPMVAPEYSDRRRALAKSIGLGTFRRKAATPEARPARRRRPKPAPVE